MRRSARRDEEWYREYCAKSDRFKVGTDQRPPDHSSRPLLPARGAPFSIDDHGPGGGMTALPSKYKNKPTNGYASIKESKRAFQLKLMQEAGQIRNLREQVEYLLIPKQEGERACSYRADFVYQEPRGYGAEFIAPEPGRVVPDVRPRWETVVEDCKGMRTEVYKIKRKLMLFVHKIRVRET